MAIASVYRIEWPLLIVCPSSVRFTWRSAVIRWMPSIPEEDILVITSGKDSLEGQVIIISYDLLARKQEEIINSGQLMLLILKIIQTSKQSQ